MPAVWAKAAHCAPNFERAIVMPLEADPVIPPMSDVLTTAENSGLPDDASFMSRSLITAKPTTLVITEPNANPDATLNTAVPEETADSLISFKKEVFPLTPSGIRRFLPITKAAIDETIIAIVIDQIEGIDQVMNPHLKGLLRIIFNTMTMRSGTREIPHEGRFSDETAASFSSA